MGSLTSLCLGIPVPKMDFSNHLGSVLCSQPADFLHGVGPTSMPSLLSWSVRPGEAVELLMTHVLMSLINSVLARFRPRAGGCGCQHRAWRWWSPEGDGTLEHRLFMKDRKKPHHEGP